MAFDFTERGVQVCFFSIQGRIFPLKGLKNSKCIPHARVQDDMNPFTKKKEKRKTFTLMVKKLFPHLLSIIFISGLAQSYTVEHIYKHTVQVKFQSEVFNVYTINCHINCIRCLRAI